MSAISTILTRLRAAIWAIDVRDDIANAIEQCYSDVSNPTLKTEALEAALQTKIDAGEMAALTIGDHTITAEKLAQGVIDNTLATSGAAADAAETGRQFGLIKADLETLANVTPIPDNSDLNDYTETGLYSIENSNYTILNYPDSDGIKSAATLEVNALTTGYIQQVMNKGAGRMFARTRFSNGVWSNWVQITRNSEYEFSSYAKKELIELLKHIPLKDSGGEAHFKNLVEALGVSVADYNILIGGNIKVTKLSDTPQDNRYFIEDVINTKRALLSTDTGEHCMTLSDGTPTSHYPVKIPASIKKIWFANAKENNFAVNIHIIYYDSTLGGYRRLLTGDEYDLHEIATFKYENGNGGIWELDISDYNNGNLFMLGTFAKSYSSTIRTDSAGNQYPQAVLTTEDVDSAVNNVTLWMI